MSEINFPTVLFLFSSPQPSQSLHGQEAAVPEGVQWLVLVILVLGCTQDKMLGPSHTE